MKTNTAWKKRFGAGAAFIVCVGAAFTLEAGVTISSLTPATGAEVTNGVPVRVTAQLATNDGSVVQSVELAYAWNGGDWNTQTMTAVSGTNYTATIPPAVSSLAFYVTCRYDTTGVAISATNAVSTTLPDYARYADRQLESLTPQDYKWVPTYYGTVYTNWVYTIGATEWVAEYCDANADSLGRPPGGSSRYFRLWSLNANVPFIRTPKMVEGVGTIYFTSMIKDTGYGAQLAVQYTTTNTLPTDWRTADIWQTATNIVYPNGTGINELYAAPIVLNNRAIRYVRFLRTDNGTTPGGGLPASATMGSINIDSIAISRPPTDVTITQMLQNPGYPSQDQDVTVRCQVNDVDAAIPSVNRRVTVTHSWGLTNLVPIGGGLYEGVIPRHGVGTNVYSFACDFDGYSYSRDPDGSGSAQTNRNERIGRAERNQLEYGIRPFHSDVQVMQVVTNPSGAAVNMELVGDHVWQWAWTNAVSSTLDWTFAGLAGYTNNASAYDASPWTWGDTNQIAPHGVPLNGFAERDTATPIAATGIASNLMIRLNRQTGEYIATAEDLALWNIAPAPGSQIGIGRAFTVGADITPLLSGGIEIVSVWLVYSWEGGATITNRMSATSTNRYEGVVPRLPVGALTNYVLAIYSMGGVTNSITSQRIGYTLTDALDASRFTDFRLGTWTPDDAAQTNYAYQVGVATSTWWIAEMGKYPVTNGAPLPPGSVSPAFGIRAQTNAFLQSPCLTNGVGTVYFTSVMGDTGQGGRVAVQYTTNSVPGNWQTATTLVYAAISGYRATNSAPVTLNNRAVRYVRFVRQDSIGGLDAGLINFDDIYLSPPPTQVTITEALYNPGYPVSNQAVTVRCRVADVDPENPSTNRLVQAHYSWNSTSGPWTQTNMVLNGAGVYEGTIPQLGAGTNYYYFTCAYDGYFYTHDPDGAGLQPSYHEDTAVNPAYLGTAAAPLGYAIRPFLSDVRVMQVVTNVSGSAIPMELESNHLWRVRTPIQGITGLSWTFAGVDGYTNNAASYAAAPWVWGDDNQASTVPPITNGVAGRTETANIVITGLTHGFLTIEMNGTNGQYSVVAEPYVTSAILSPAGGAGLTNGALVTIVAQLAVAHGASVITGSVVLSYAWNNGSVITQAMTAVMGTNLYTATIPPAVTSLSYSVAWQYTLDGVTYTGGLPSTSNAVSSTLLDYVRYADFDVTNAVALDNAWVNTPGTSNWVYTIGSKSWMAEKAAIVLPAANDRPPGGSNTVIRLNSLQGGGSYVQTPYLAEGVGTIYYTSVMSDAGYSAQMIIQYTTNSLPENWQNAWTNNYNNYPSLPTAGVKATNAIPVVLTNRNVRYVRFWRTDDGANAAGGLPSTPNEGSIDIDNIYVSRPPTDVVITQLLQNPGYPATNQAVTVRCQVNDVDSAIPSVNRLVQVHYSWNNASGPWTQTNMVQNGAGVYEWMIPQLGAGTNYYYFTCDFDGYSYSRDPDGLACALQTNRNERIGRAELGPFEYVIRPFLSDVRVMQVVTNVSGSAIPMELESNHLWRVRTPIQGITGLSWTFAGVDGYTNNAASYAAAPWVWGDDNQASTVLPITNGVAGRAETANIVITGLPHGFLTIEMNGTNGRYSVVAEPYVTSAILSPAGGAGLTNGAPVTIVAQLAEANGASVITGSVVLSYAWNNGSVITQVMTAVMGTNLYTATIPPAATSLSYSVAWQYTLDGVTYTGGLPSTSNAVSSTLLDYVRYADFDVTNAVAMDNAWVNTPGTSNWVYTIGSKSWTAEKAAIVLPATNDQPPGGSNTVIRLNSLQGGGSYAQTPYLAEGVGTIYYTSVMSDAGYSAQMIIQYTTNSLPENWQNAWTNNYNNYPSLPTAGVKATNAIPVVLTNRNVRYVRFWRTDDGANAAGGLPSTPNEGSIDIDNIYVSRPPTDVVITQLLQNPGYPATNQAVTVRCQVNDVDSAIPSVNRLVQVHYSWNNASGPWTQTNMVQNGAGVYEWMIPQLGAGTNHYYFTCDFDGYSYSRDPDGPACALQTNRNERIGRAELGPFEYVIRPFRSDVRVMQVVTNVSGSAIPMELESNHLWRVRTPIHGITGLSWTFAGVDGYTNNAAGYAAAPWVWGVTNQAPIGLPITNGVAVRDVTTNIVITGLADGLLTIEMNGTNGRYTVVAETYVTSAILSPAGGTGLTNGSPVTIMAQLTAAHGASVVTGSVVLSYVWNNGSVITQAMTAVTGTNLFTVTIPPAVTSLSYSVTWQYTLDGATYTAGSSSTSNAVSSTLLDYVRYADRNQESLTPQDYKWVPTYYGTVYTNWVYTIGATEWVAEYCDSNSEDNGMLPPGGASRYFRLWSLNANVPFIRTPKMAEGVGTIYFTSKIKNPGYGAQLAVQYTTTNTLPADWRTADIWQTATNIVYPRGTGIRELYATPIVLNNRDIRYVRFLRTDNGAKPNGYLPKEPIEGAINIDNIYISHPPTGVTITEKLYNPGYPAQDQDVKVRCQADDMDLTVPSVNRRVKVWYSWESESGPWTQTNMVSIAERVYEGVIPQRGAGRMYYWFQCDLDGYFYSRDPDGPTGPQPTRDEKVGRSPVYLIEKGEDNYRSYEIRRYRSDVEVMRVVCSNEPSASINTMDLVDDHVWQGLTLVSGITNLLWTFVGTNGYANDAEAFDTNTWSWGDNDQDFPYPPVAGYAERNATNSIKAELVYNGTLLIRMNGQTGEYLVKRAVYQNFDVWPASQTDFEESLGLFAIQTFKQDFNTNNWGYGYDAYTGNYTPVTVDGTPPNGFVRGGPPFGRTEYPTWDSWWYDYARVVKERNVLTAARHAIELEGVAARGHVWKTPADAPSLGIETFEFKARLSLNDRHFTYFKGTNGFNPFVESPNWPKGYWVETTFNAASLSPGMASCSVLTWFTPGASTESGEPSYYETCLMQADPTSGGASQLQLALYRWKDGVSTSVGTPQMVTGGQAFENELTTLKSLRVQMPASGNTITARVGRIDESSGTNIWYYTATFSDSTPLTDMGTVGFISYDAQPEISSVNVFAGTNTANLLPGLGHWGAAGGLNSTNWYMGGKRTTTDSAFRWKVTGNSLIRDIPTQTLKINTYPMPDRNSYFPDGYKDQKTIANYVVTSLGYTTFIVPLNLWDAHFVEIQNAGVGEINAVVDELSLTPWRAATRADNKPVAEQAAYNWTSPSQQETWMGLIANKACWLVMEGWINTSSGSKGGEVQFIRSRANTNLVQALVSPYLANNIGSIAFDWRASGVSNVVFAIDRTDRYGYPAWVSSPVLLVTNDALSGTVNLAIRTDYPGRIRIRLCEGSAPNAVFKIDNLVVRDYPPRDDTTWQAYNALITAAQPSRAFDPTKPSAQTAFLNNDPTNGVALSERLDQYQPFIQTPKVGTGIGEITFWYRVWNTNGPAVISLEAARDENGPWKTLTNIVVASTQTNYLFFSNDQIYEPDNQVLRIYGSTNANRVCIDNVLMTEPVRAGYEFRLVSLLPAQPLVGEPPGLKVEIGRFIMNPTNIRIYASWFVGTNTWGYTNWWSTAYAKVELTNSPGAPRIFQTPDSVVLPAGAVDDVVQFFVWGVHGGIDIAHGDRPILQETNAFVNPSWYYPADLNAVTPSIQAPELPAFGSRGWSPYYYVYSCPPYSVWVNELRYFYWDWSEYDTEFFEIIGPAGAALSHWQLQMMSTENNLIKESVITNGFVLKNATNGWGFLIWGDDAMSSYGDHILFPGWAAGWDDVPQAGGVRVVRSNGAWEDRVAWGYGSESLVSDYGYTYASTRDSEYTLSLRSVSTNQGSEAIDFIWGTVEATPYAVNKFQRLYDNSEVPSGFYMIYSAIGPNGAHSLGTNPGTIEIAPGGSTNIVYTADTWYRIGTMQTNGVPVGAAPGLKAYTQEFVNVRSAISNQVTFTNANWDQTGLTNSVPIPWASSYYPASEAAAVANTNIVLDYLLNISPTNNHAIAFAIESITVSNTVTVTVKLTDGGDPLATTINGAVKLYGKPTLNASNWSVIADATVSNASFNVSGKYTLPAVSTSTNTFFKANIE